jgi:hypothetical protein
MPLWMILSVSFGASLLAAVPMYILMKRGERRAKARLTEIAGRRQALRQAGARCFGVRSKGKAQVRPGAGGLVLFDDELVFVPLVGGGELRIPRASILGIQRAKGYLGKRVGSELLQVAWKHDAGVEASAWQVRELDAWIAALGGERGADDEVGSA